MNISDITLCDLQNIVFMQAKHLYNDNDFRMCVWCTYKCGGKSKSLVWTILPFLHMGTMMEPSSLTSSVLQVCSCVLWIPFCVCIWGIGNLCGTHKCIELSLHRICVCMMLSQLIVNLSWMGGRGLRYFRKCRGLSAYYDYTFVWISR